MAAIGLRTKNVAIEEALRRLVRAERRRRTVTMGRPGPPVAPGRWPEVTAGMGETAFRLRRNGISPEGPHR